MTDREFTSSKNLDMTPAMASNWSHRCPTKAPILMVNPEASLHDRVALAYALVGELGAIAWGLSEHQDDNVPQYVMSLMSDRLDKLDALLSDIGNRTSAMPQPAVA